MIARAVFSIAEVTTVVLGFQNTGSKNYNVTSIWGALTSPFQSRMFIQNVRASAVAYATHLADW